MDCHDFNSIQLQSKAGNALFKVQWEDSLSDPILQIYFGRQT